MGKKGCHRRYALTGDEEGAREDTRRRSLYAVQGALGAYNVDLLGPAANGEE